MNKRKALQLAARIYPLMQPTRASGFATSDGCVVIAGHDVHTVTIIHTEKGISRLLGMCRLALQQRERAADGQEETG